MVVIRSIPVVPLFFWLLCKSEFASVVSFLDSFHFSVDSQRYGAERSGTGARIDHLCTTRARMRARVAHVRLDQRNVMDISLQAKARNTHPHIPTH